MSESVVIKESDPYPPAPSLEETLEFMRREHGFSKYGLELAPKAWWVERERRILIPKRLISYVTKFHVLIPSLNLHIIHVRVRDFILAHGGVEDVKESEWVEFHPWCEGRFL